MAKIPEKYGLSIKLEVISKLYFITALHQQLVWRNALFDIQPVRFLSQVVAISREEELGTADSLRKVGFKKLFNWLNLNWDSDWPFVLKGEWQADWIRPSCRLWRSYSWAGPTWGIHWLAQAEKVHLRWCENKLSAKLLGLTKCSESRVNCNRLTVTK